MKRKLCLALVLLFALSACATLNLRATDEMTGTEEGLTPQEAYYYALRFYNGAWESYHKVWTALPEPTKTEWVKKYHVQFKTAGMYLQTWGNNVTDPTNKEGWRVIKDELQTLLIQLAIKK